MTLALNYFKIVFYNLKCLTRKYELRYSWCQTDKKSFNLQFILTEERFSFIEIFLPRSIDHLSTAERGTGPDSEDR